MCQIFVIHVSFQTSERPEVDPRLYVIKILFHLNSQRNELFSQRTYDFQSLGNEALFIANHEDVKKLHLIGWLQNYGSKKAFFCEILHF